MKFFFALSLALTFSCHAQIKEVNSMKDVFKFFDNADEKTLAIFDVDMVLIQPSEPAFQMATMKRFSHVCKRILNSVPKDKQMMFLGLMTLTSPPLLIDEQSPEFLNEIMQRGIPTMALTANLTGKFGSIEKMEQLRIDNLRRLGIDFSKSPPHPKSIVFEDLATYRGNYSTYLHGMLFVNGTTVSKGEALLSFLTKIDFCPNKIIFVDDRIENLKSLEESINKLNKLIDYQGLHFLGAQHYPSKLISEEEFANCWQKLALETTILN